MSCFLINSQLDSTDSNLFVYGKLGKVSFLSLGDQTDMNLKSLKSIKYSVFAPQSAKMLGFKHDLLNY